MRRSPTPAPELKPFFDQFAYPVIRYDATPDGYVAVLGDVRYQLGGRGFNYQVVLSRDLQVLEITDGSTW